MINIATLLKKNISKGQLAGYAFANLIGLTVILCGILFYCDSRHHRKTTDRFFSEDYVVISKKVSGISLEPVAFSEREIGELSSQPWVKKLGSFTPADFSVVASVNMGGKGMSTYLFFEAVPDDFFDILPEGWEFNPDDKFVPIVLNKDYLALYNFGFALPQGLPQLSEEVISTVPLKLMISGENGAAEIYNASIVGFSSRLNTIAVPQSFMDWANSKYSNSSNHEISRLILKIDRLNNKGMDKYLSQHDYEIAGDKDGESKMAHFMGVISGVVAATGFVIALLALFILLLSIFLLLQKSRPTLRNLILLGYSPQQVSLFYRNLVLIMNLSITLLAVGFTFVCRLIWHKSLEALGLGDGNVLFTLGAAILYFVLISLVNILVIRRHLFSIWKS